MAVYGEVFATMLKFLTAQISIGQMSVCY